MTEKYACYHRAVMPGGRTARPFLSRCALTFSLLAAPQPFDAASFSDLLKDLAALVAGKLQPDNRVEIVSRDPALARDFRNLLGQQGVGRPEAVRVAVTVACADTLYARVCAATVQRDSFAEILSVRGAHDRGSTTDAPPVVLQARPLVVDQAPILDVAISGTRLIVLHPSSLARYERAGDGWRLQEVRPTIARVWPRDVRGRIEITGTRMNVFLPGASCRGAIDSMQLECADGSREWPIGFENTGMPSARNYITTAKGPSYYSAAALSEDAGARWIAATPTDGLVFLDAALAPLGAATPASDELAAVSTACMPGAHLILRVASADAPDGDVVRMFRVANRRLIPASPPLFLTGALTALSPVANGDGATAITYNPPTARYEAFQITVSCSR